MTDHGEQAPLVQARDDELPGWEPPCEDAPRAERPENEYLRFEERWHDGRKTPVVLVFSARSGDVLAHLTWWGPWRQFVFKPSERTVWNVGCLATIDSYIAALMADHRVGER